jgi:predicted nucleotidyltransferase
MARRIDDGEDEQSVRAWIRLTLQERFGRPLLRLILAGSRAKSTNGPNSDWDVIAVIEGFRSIWPVGPMRMSRNAKLRAPDGNEVDVLEVNPADLSHPDAQTNCLIREALAHNIDL